MYSQQELDAYDAEQNAPAAPPPAAGAPPPAAGAPAAPAATTPVQTQAQAAQTYSATPGAAPAPNTTNQGTQDVVRNTYLQRATQPVNVDPNSAEIKAQVDPYAAAQERSRRQYESEAAERLSAQGKAGSGEMDIERRLGAERAGQNTGMFEAQLIGRELQTKRDEIKEALSALSGLISQDQVAELQRQLAEVDRQIKMHGIDTGASTAGAEIGVKKELGYGGLNIDLMRLLQQGQMFGDQLGFNIADREAYYNSNALQNLLG